MNSNLVRQALDKIGNPNILVNLVSRRVRALGDGRSRPLVDDTAGLGVADIALLEFIHDKIGYECLEPADSTLPAPKPRKRRRKS